MNHHITDALLKAAAKHYSKKLSAAQREYIRDYYHRLPNDDFSLAATEELITAALNHRALAANRKPDQTLVGIYNQKTTSAERDPCTVLNTVTDDSPFLVDSLSMLLTQKKLTIHRTIHPVFQVKRTRANRIIALKRRLKLPDSRQETSESFIQFHIDYVGPEEHNQLVQEVHTTIENINTIVTDWSPMREKMRTLADELESDHAVDDEYSLLLRWLENHHFALLGYCELSLSGSVKKPLVRANKSSALGFMRSLNQADARGIHRFLPPLESCRDTAVTITKTRQRSSIHRPAFMDCIMINRPTGRSRRICCILGLLSAEVFVKPTSEIPLLQKKSAEVLIQSTLGKYSYAYKALAVIIETLPRESLFQMDTESIFQTAMEILNHQERRKTSIYIHQDRCGHFYSCLVYVPRDLFRSKLRLQIQRYLIQALAGGDFIFNVYFSESILTRIHFVIHTKTGKPVEYDPSAIEHDIQRISRDWNDSLRIRLAERHGGQQARSLMKTYTDSFPGSYRNDFRIADAVEDIDVIEATAVDSISSALYVADRGANCTTHLKIYSCGKPIPLSDVLPILENLGLRVIGERPYKVRRKQQNTIWMYDFEIVRQDSRAFDLAADGDNLRQTFYRVWCGDAENDGFNQLVLDTGLDWRQIVMLRACFKYLRQIRLRYSQRYVIDALKHNRPIVVQLANLFAQRFNPALNQSPDQSDEQRLRPLIMESLEQVESLDEDRILHAILDVIGSILRTNYYQLDHNAEHKTYLSFKIDSKSVPRIPEPKPKYEIFVYSPRFEGIHLRGGDVARGGLRWSDRPEDFRTEVLGLVKAQRVKNAVIVPVGSKGGFVPKHLPAERDAMLKEAKDCYKNFISGLLDLTDNLSANQVIPPPQVIRHDGDDPYLVVAADKGTATFSDIANEISEQRGFWLGDAFASGGSMGYDHKKMGITARGAWESVKRHFRELGKDIQSTDFTVTGIGDMSGDVFGNGMLLSKHIRLVAAFNHMHIFIDPQADAASSFKERQRLFGMDRSSWSDYDSKLISSGGGIFERKLKSIKLSPQIKQLLQTDRSRCSPTELINLILKMPVELLWNGGIGTYIKASHESHEDAQDKANDSLRIDADDLRCRVIGEGGNLGVTQYGRIEFSALGGLCNNDAIDNSAGVDTSDHEVNIKILLNRAIEDGNISSRQRNNLLAKMEREIGELVLRNNYSQTQTISIAASRGLRALSQQTNIMHMLEQRGLNRALEYLPDDAELEQRVEAGKALTRPELSVLLSYSKMDLYRALLASEVPDDAALSGEIEAYFPTVLSQRFKPQMHSHRLKREITATHLTNRLIGRMGFSFHLLLQSLTVMPAHEIARAWFAMQDIMHSDPLVDEVEALDNRIAAGLQLELLFELAAVMKKSVIWLLRQTKPPIDIKQTIATYQMPVAAIIDAIDHYIPAAQQATIQQRQSELADGAVPAALAAKLARLPWHSDALEIAAISIVDKTELKLIAATYFQVSEDLGLAWVATSIDRLSTENQWHERARFALASDLAANHAAITQKILRSKRAEVSTTATADWWLLHATEVAAIQQTVVQLKEHEHPDFAMLSVLMSALSQLS